MLSGKAASAAKLITLKTPEQIQIMRAANQIVAETLKLVAGLVRSGVTTLHLDVQAEEFARSRGAVPAFKGYHGFPGSLCVSVNEQVVHGIPSEKMVLKDGDIVSVDFGVNYKGFYGDAAVTLPVGEISPKKKDLLKVTRESLYLGIEKVRVGNRIDDISRAVQEHVEKHGYSVVRQFVGHGIGANLHEGPEIPNYGRDEATPRLLAGMVLAIEPMVNMGGRAVRVLADDWTVVTEDMSPSAHFEHSVAVTEDGPYILSEGTE